MKLAGLLAGHVPADFLRPPTSMIRHSWLRPLLGTALFILALPHAASAQSAQSSKLYAYDGSTGEHLGAAVVELGDVDGDTRADYAIGAVGANNWRGQVRVISGSRGTLIYAIDGLATGDRFGSSLAALPDLDGDSIGELLVGAPLAQGAAPGSGQVYVRSGANGGGIFVRGGDGAQDHMGWSVASVGDLDGDGVADFAAGAIDDDNFGSSSGSVRIWSGANASAIATISGYKKEQLFGYSIERLGDWNADGVSDFAVGAPSIAASPDTGFVRVYSGADRSILATLTGLNSSDNFGAAIANIGDLDGDGRADLAVGSPQKSPASTGQVDVHLAAGGPFLFRLLGSGIADRFGTALSAAGDVDGDGVPDFVVGAPGFDLPQATDTGSLICFSGADASVLFTHYGVDLGMPVGTSIDGASDVNEDGRPDLVLGSPGNLAVSTDRGGAMVLSSEPLSFWSADFVVSAAQPAPLALAIDLGPAFAQADYIVLGSITGLAPKTTIGGLTVPLALDRYFRFTLQHPENGMLQGGAGQLDLQGRATAVLQVLPSLLSAQYYGTTFFHAALVFDGQGTPIATSNPLPVTVVP